MSGITRVPVWCQRPKQCQGSEQCYRDQSNAKGLTSLLNHCSAKQNPNKTRILCRVYIFCVMRDLLHILAECHVCVSVSGVRLVVFHQISGY